MERRATCWDEMIVRFARTFISHGWSHSVSDTVAQRITLAHVDGLERIVEKEKLRACRRNWRQEAHCRPQKQR